MAHGVNGVKFFKGFNHFVDLLRVLLLFTAQMSTDQDQVINKCYNSIVIPQQFFFKLRQVAKRVLALEVIKIMELFSPHHND